MGPSRHRMRERIFRDVDIRRQLIRLLRLRTPLGNTSGNRHVASTTTTRRFNFRQALHTVAIVSRILMFFFHTFPRYIPPFLYYCTLRFLHFLISSLHFLFYFLCSNRTDGAGEIGSCEIKIDANTYRFSELSLET